MEWLKQLQGQIPYQYAVKTPVTKKMKPKYSVEHHWNILNEMEFVGYEEVCRVLLVSESQMVTRGIYRDLSVARMFLQPHLLLKYRHMKCNYHF